VHAVEPSRRLSVKSCAGMLEFTNEQLSRISLLVFTFQNAAFVLLMRGSKLMNTHYNSSVAVLVTEILKLPLTTLLLCYEKGGVSAACAQMHKDIVLAPKDTLKISIPALLYTIQNNALFIAVENLEAAVFQCTYQLKTLTTAILVVVVLGRTVKPHQWFALLLLMSGTVMVQDPPKQQVGADGEATGGSVYLGIGATVVACLCSSFASVYLEKILVESTPSIWVRCPPGLPGLPSRAAPVPSPSGWPSPASARPPELARARAPVRPCSGRCATRSCASSPSPSPLPAPSWWTTRTCARTAPPSTASTSWSGRRSSPTRRAA
jgi:drug/metabolite transporter (DMT)-like permease